MRLGEGGSPPASQYAVFVEGWSYRHEGQWNPGMYGRNAISGRECSSVSAGVYNYDGGLPRAYLEGSAHAGGVVDNETVHLTASNAHRDELGWNTYTDLDEEGHTNRCTTYDNPYTFPAYWTGSLNILFQPLLSGEII